MYNDSAKMRFVNEVYSGEQVRSNIIRLLERISVYEMEASKDLCDFSVDELKPVIDSVAGILPRSIVQVKNTIASYMTYSGSSTTKELVMSIDIDSSYKIANQMVKDSRDLLDMLTLIFPPEDIVTRNTLYRCFVWLAFSGIDVDDVSDVKIRDINFESGLICFGGDVYPIYGESVNDLRSACDSSVLYEHIKAGKFHPTIRVNNGCVLRGTSDLSGSYQRMRSAMAKLITFRQEETGLPRKISYRKAYLSGVFSRALSQIEISPEEYLMRVRYEEMRRRNCRHVIETTRPAKEYAVNDRDFQAGVKSYIDGFYSWKAAFHID